MARDSFARATKSILRRLGQDALLRGAPAGFVHIEDGVEVYERNHEGEAVFHRSVATIEKGYAPKHGDQLVILSSTDGSFTGEPQATYTVQGLYADNGVSIRRIVMPVST